MVLLQVVLGGLVVAACSDDGPTQPGGDPVVITAAGDISGAVGQYRELLGDPLNTTPGPHAGGRRELNWDGLADDLAAPFFLPPGYFNAAAGPNARGATLTTPGAGVQVSADGDNPSGAAVRFGHINPGYSAIFQTYSAERLFSPIGSNIVELTFSVPGTTTPGVVRGFGAVYTDVDEVENTAFEYFDAQGRSLGRFSTPVADGGLSFLGVAFPTPIVHKVRIAYGNAALGPDDGGAVDAAVMDDFLYSEPQPAASGN